jgi:site-specific DNA recombinase
MAKRAVLYARVSTSDQAGEDKTSLSEQLRDRKLYAERNGYEIVDEVAEDVSGRKHRTEGLNTIRDLAEDGEIDAILVYKWNRLARKAIKQELFIEEMRVEGVDVISLDGQSNKTSQGRAMNRIQGVFGELQRDDLVETTRRGKLGQARQGNVMPGRHAPYGFVYDANIKNYRVDEDRMKHVRRVFEMVGTEGTSMRAVKTAFDRQGIPTPSGQRYWSAGTIREIIKNDVYKSYTDEDLADLVAAGNLTASVMEKALDGNHSGIQWYGRTRWEHDADVGNTKHHVTPNDRDEWIAVPVPDAGVPREWVDKARSAIKDNVRPSRAAGRDWELKGFMYCLCGCRLSPRTVRHYLYYACTRYTNNRQGGCEHGENWPAKTLEVEVKNLIIALLDDDELWKATVTDQIRSERERLQDPDKEAEAVQRHINDLDRRRDNLIDMAADGTIPRQDVRAKLPELDKQKREAKQAFARVMDRQQRSKELMDLEAVVLSIDPDNPSVIIFWPDQDEDDPNGYKKLLQKLGLRAIKYKDGTLELAGNYGSIVSEKCASPRCTASAMISSSLTPARSRGRTSRTLPRGCATGTSGLGRTGYSCLPPQRSPT